MQFLNNNSDEVTDNKLNRTDRIYGGRDRDNGMSNNFGKNTKTLRLTVPLGFWSTKHTPEERSQAASKWQHTAISTCRSSTPEAYQNFLAHCEGIEFRPESQEIDEMEQLIIEIESENQDISTFFTEFGDLDGNTAMSILDDNAITHVITRQNHFNPKFYCNPHATDEVFTFNKRYSSENFQGIMPEIGAAGVSTGVKPQF
ncbi:integrase and RNaseH domain-containing protein [Golovinomyces cichoracearum]|uniref:Integrase and RNaseH domain-containing protein n=1 Tax=Golovinomyces cichoracearum TaxID=62708 RepID=A0A420JC35_9PEZI|nr:integrase and RNaseH domain-containing protein [Golovinomyces cichoracearum]